MALNMAVACFMCWRKPRGDSRLMALPLLARVLLMTQVLQVLPQHETAAYDCFSLFTASTAGFSPAWPVA